MHPKKRLVLIFLLFILTAQISMGIEAQNASTAAPCLNNMEQTQLKAKALLRAHRCQQTGRFRDCQAQMGLGIAGGLLQLSKNKGRQIAQKLKTLRDPAFYTCALKKTSLHWNPRLNPILFMYATNSWADPTSSKNQPCIQPIEIDKAQVKAVHQELSEKINSDIEKIKSEIKNNTQDQLNPSRQEIKVAEQAHNLASDDLTRYLKKNLVPNGYGEYNFKALIRSFEKNQVNIDYIEKALKDFAQDHRISLNQSEWQRIKENILNTQRKLDSAYDYNTRLAAKYEGLKNTEPYLKSLKSDLAELTKTKNILDALNEPINSVMNTRAEIQESAKILEQILDDRAILNSAGENMTLQMQNITHFAEIPKDSEISYRFADNFKKAKNALAESAKTNPRLRLFSLALLLGVSGSTMAEPAQEALDVANKKADPFGVVTEVLSSAYESRCGSQKNELFPRDPHHSCQMNYAINDKTERILESDTTHLKDLISMHPEACEFIQNHFKKFYGVTQSNCTHSNITFKLATGAEFKVSGSKIEISHLPKMNAHRSGAILLNSEMQIEETMECPVSTRGSGEQGKVKVAFGSESMGNYTQCQTLLDTYTTALPVIQEIKSCFEMKGAHPSAQECASYGPSCNLVQASRASSTDSENAIETEEAPTAQ